MRTRRGSLTLSSASFLVSLSLSASLTLILTTSLRFLKLAVKTVLWRVHAWA